MPRLTKIYTRTGDQGTTGLASGERISKDHPRIQAMGDLDELNSLIGVLRSVCPDAAALAPKLAAIQHRLFDLGGELALPDQVFSTSEWVTTLEHWIDAFNADLPSLKEFILPAGTLAAAHCHHARSVCRRAERSLWQLSEHEAVNPHSLCYLNRLSDVLFVMARVLARLDGAQEVTWQPDIKA
ncbi:MAG: cob(I)yrinic acid a,c-diamide adenosyltransferase [Pseudomonadota bacterium]